jgi:hypothetical protein
MSNVRMSTMAQTDDDELYGDLEDDVKPSSSTTPRQINIQQERQEIANLRKEVARLQKENEVLKRNIGTLYRTATNEIQRLRNRQE